MTFQPKFFLRYDEALFSSPADHDSVHDAQMQEYILLRHVDIMALEQAYWNQRQAAGSWTVELEEKDTEGGDNDKVQLDDLTDRVIVWQT